jgi:myo-inositol-1(or 4)-monophosphatase
LEIESLLQAARSAARTAGALIRKRFPDPTQVGQRQLTIQHKGRIDLVTEVDTACERLIREELLERFPEYAFLGEEGGASGPEDVPLWIVDPLDGTRSFAHGYPFVAVSIALEVAGKIRLGVVYDPLRDELFEASLGNGALLNGSPLTVSATPKLGDALLVSGFPYRLAEIDNRPLFGLLREFILKSGGFRRDGAAALDFCYLAAGRIDGFWEFFLAPWDAAAGSLIVSEAGGRITDLAGNPFAIRRPVMLASNGHIHQEMVDLARPFLEDVSPYSA